MNYTKNTVRYLMLPYVVDFRDFPKLSKKSLNDTLTIKDYISWLKETGRKVEYVTKKIRKDRISRKIRRDRKSTRLNSSHIPLSRMPSSA